MRRAITSALETAALTIAIAVPVLADPPYVLVDIVVGCETPGGPVVDRVDEGPPGQVRPLIAEWFRNHDCAPGTKEVDFGKRPLTFGSICLGIPGTYTPAGPDGPEMCEFIAPQWSDFRRTWGKSASHCRGKPWFILDAVAGEATVACVVK